MVPAFDAVDGVALRWAFTGGASPADADFQTSSSIDAAAARALAVQGVMRAFVRDQSGNQATIDLTVSTDLDAGADAGTNAGVDAGTNAGADAGTDAGADAGTGAGADAGTDAGADVATDAGMGEAGELDQGMPPSCGCGSSSVGSGGLLTLAALLLSMQRRRTNGPRGAAPCRPR